MLYLIQGHIKGKKQESANLHALQLYKNYKENWHRTIKMAQQVKTLATKTDLSSIPVTHMGKKNTLAVF